MFNCKGIYKIFQDIIVIEDFSYQFREKGFYLLFGESGSGKTTFLNILSGLLPYEKGTITVGDDEFAYTLEKECMAKKCDYITQDAYFVDFLNVLDNLKLICDDETYITQMLERFGLETKIRAYPTKMSGGEKQRLAIIRSLMSGKKILLLDEPTASLDQENKQKIFEMLADIKDEALIICSSHDKMAMDYADEIIRFEKQHNRCMDVGLTERKEHIRNHFLSKKCVKPSKEKSEQTDVNKKCVYFLRKWFGSNKRSKISSVLFCLFMTIAMGICMLVETPTNRLNSNIEFIYKVNMCILRTYGEDVDEYYRLWELDGVKEVVFDYRLSLPDVKNWVEENGTIVYYPVKITYEQVAPVLPFEDDVFRLADQILYGTYFTEANQTILTLANAEELAEERDVNVESLVGQTMKVEFYGIGEVELEIVGIFNHFDEIERVYMQAMDLAGYSLNDGSMWFINAKLTEQMVEDETLYATEDSRQRGFVLYFDSYSSLRMFYEEYREVYLEKGDFLYINVDQLSLLGLFELIYKVCLPLAFVMALFTVLFYINLIKTELVYNNKFISVMDYAGYSVKKVVNCFIGLNILHLLKNCSISMMITLVITNIVNMINEKHMFLEFRIFSYNIVILLIFIGFLLLVSAGFMYLFLKRFKKMNWYENMIKNRDLI